MDFQDGNERDPNLVQDQGSLGDPGTGDITLPTGQNIVTLPQGTSIEALSVDGRDLIIELDNGARIVVPDGAVFVPQIIADGVAVPPLNIAQLLTGNEPEPAAGASQSSGGNFADDEGAIQDAFDLGDLLPFTDFGFPEDREEEIIPDTVNEEPEVVIETPDNPTGVQNAIATVDEEGLPARGENEPEGTNEPSNVETTAGTIVFDAPDGLSAVLINGVEITSIGQSFTSPFGTLTITSINLAGGEIGFSYTLEDNALGEDRDGFFEVTVIDIDGDQAMASLSIIIVDDGPIAIDDIGIVPAGSHATITGDVLANDVPGADGYDTSGAVASFGNGTTTAESGNPLQGEYGVLTLNADGSYSYTRDINTPGGVEESFTYTIVDQDGSTSTATLVIQIGDAPDAITRVPQTGEGTVVDEGGLPTRDEEPAGTGEIADDDGTNNSDGSEATGSTITFNSPDGVASVTINGVAIDPSNLPQTIIEDPNGTLVITGFTYDPITGDGSIDYEFTLGDNTSGDDTSFDFVIQVTDLDGDTASDTLTINVIDDEPAADDDTSSQAQEDAPVTVNVLANDTPGADDVQPTAIALVDGTLSGQGSIAYNGDGTFTYTPVPGEEGTVTFDYTITDGDGDISTATVTITLLEDSEPAIAVEGDNDAAESGLPARAGEPAGSDSTSDGEIANGVIAITTGNDSIGALVINGVDVTAGGTVATAKGELVITASEGGYTYSYTLTDNTLSDPDSDSFSLAVTDSDGDTASTTLVIAIVDDTPTALDDANAIAAGQYGPVGGNVVANDTQGADAVAVSAYSGAGGMGSAGDTVQGTYGKLTIAADGTYSYTRDPGTPGGVSDTFSYTITDGDGDVSTANLIISIADSGTSLDLPAAGEAGTQVEEDGLAGPPAGSDAVSNSEFTTGTFTFAAPDGPAVITIGGVAISAVGQTFTGTYGTLTIDAIANGAITYTYELTTNTSGDATQDDFVVRVTDQDGDFSEDTLEIAIVDDAPAANLDSDSVTEDGPVTADGNVLTGSGGADANATDGVADVTGADGATVTAIAFGATTGTAGSPLAGAYGQLTLNADGSYSYALDNQNPLVQGLDDTESLTETFTYTITDGDGDTSTTTLIITIDGADDPVVIAGLDGQGAEETLFEDDLADGSSPDAGALTQTGSFSVTGTDGIVTLTIAGQTVFTAASATTYPVTIDDPTYGLLTITGVAITTDANGDVVAATVSYSYVLEDNSLLHTGANDGSFTNSFEVIATDSNGSTDTASLDITVVDDVATANDDTAGQVAENQSIVIDTFANDVFGADGVDTGDATKVFVATQAAQGTVTYDPTTGLFTYVPDPGAGSNGNVTDSFQYTIIDGDGDASTATVTITLQPDSEPRGSETTAAVDDDGLVGNNPLSNTGDLDANVDDDPADTSEATYTGVLPFDVGNDTPATVTFDASINGATALIGQETVTYSVVGTLLTATITGGPRDGTDLFTVEITNSTTGTYQVTVLDNVLHTAGNNENNAFASIDFTITDSDGDTTLTNLGITFDDDAPTATNNTALVTEGGETAGNVLIDDDGYGVDAAGADGYGLSGAIIRIDSENQTTNSTTVDGSGNIVLAGQYGTLTVNVTTGVYTYDSTANATNADAQDVFTYTIVDGDGDEATATLTVNVENVAGQVSDNDVIVNEAGLPTGSDPTSDSEIDADGQITVTGATGTLTYTLLSPADGTYGTLVLNSATGEYTYTLDTPFTDTIDENGANVVNGAEGFNYEVRDQFNNLIGTGTIEVSIIDDIPTATDQTNINVAEDAVGTIGGNVMTDETPDTEGADGATITAITIDGNTTAVPQDGTSVTVNTINGTYTINMDGVWTFDPNPNLDHTNGNIAADFTYTLTDGDGDFDTAVQPITITDGADPSAGPDITFELNDEHLADGSDSAADDFDSDTIAFTEGSDDIVSIVFGDTSALGGGLTWLRVSDTQITGSDGGRLVVTLDLAVDLVTNTATVTATLNDNYDDHPTANVDDIVDLGDVEVIAKDIDGDTVSATVSVAVSDDLPSISATDPSANALEVDETNLALDATADFSTLFTSAYNADNPGTPISYALGINVGSTGITDVATDQAVVLVMNGGVVEGRTQTSNELVFTVSVNTAGVVELDQIRAVTHPDNTSDNEPTGFAAANLITLTATIVDSDGDTDTATANIAGAMTFRDDGPDAVVTNAVADMLVLDESPLPAAGDGIRTVSADFADNFGAVIDYGADGAGSVGYTLLLSANDIGSGLFALGAGGAQGSEILLSLSGNTVTGSVGATDYFTITVNPLTGQVTFTQLENIWHGDDTNADDLETLTLDGMGEFLRIEQTVTDRDNDSDSAFIELGNGTFKIEDDGPSVTLSGSNPDLQVSDADFTNDASISFVGAFTFDGGTDGQQSTSYALSTTSGSASGIYDTISGNQVFLFLESGVVVGREGTDAIAAAGGQVVFTVSVTAGGLVTLDQQRAVDHNLSNLDGANATLLADNLVQLTATITDSDDDTDSATLNIGSDLLFADDTPTAEPTLEATLDDDALGGNLGGPDDQDPDTSNLTGTLVDPTEGFGNDGGSVAFDMTSTLPAGFRLVADPGSDGVVIEQEQGTGNWVAVVTVALDETTGNYVISQNANILHEDDAANEENEVSFTLGAILTDGDTDTALTSLTITVDDDTPTATNDGEIATVDDNATGVDIGAAAGLLTNDSFGADGQGDPAITNISAGSLGGTVTIVGGQLIYTSATNITAPFADQVETFTYTIEDGDGDTTTATFQVRLTDEGAAINAAPATFTVDEEGLGGIAGNGDDDGDVPGEVVLQTGNLTGLDFGVDGAGDITLTAVADTGLVTLAGNAVKTEWDGLTHTLTGKDSVTDAVVFTLKITDVATGAYEFELKAPVKHPTPDTEDDRSLSVEVVVTDAEGESATGTISVTIDDDSPVAQDDTDSLGEDDTSTDGNVITGVGTDSALVDGAGADGLGDPAVILVSGFNGPGVIDGDTIGQWGTLVLNNDGSYIYTPNTAGLQFLDDGDSETDTFTYTMIDADGDTSEATLIITINGANDAPVANPDTNWTIEDAASPITGDVLSNEPHPGAPSGTFADVADTDIDGDTLTVSTVATFAGAYGELTLNANGTYSYRLYTEGENPTAHAAVQALDEGDTPLTDSFNYTATDGDLSDGSTLTISIFGTNDAPVVGTATVATSDEGLAGGLPDTVGNPTDTTNLATASGAISITDVDDTTFTVTLSLPTESLAVTDGSVSGAPIAWSLSPDGKTLTGTINGGTQTAITVVIDDGGAFTVTQALPIFHTDTTSEDVTSFTVDVTVNDGTITTTQSDAITVNLEDDSPEVVVADNMIASNVAGTTAFADLDADNDVDNNFGGDGGRVIFTQATIDALVAQGLTSDFSNLSYSISPDGTVLTAVKEGTTDTVFTITLNPGSNPDDYVLNLVATIDATSDINFNDGTYDFVGGNDPWAGFVPNGQNPFGSGGGAYVDDDSQDLLLTPFSDVGDGNAINGNANSAGVTGGGGGQNIGADEGIRLDFVIDLEGDPAKGVGGGADYDGDVVQQDHSFDGHYDVNGALVRFGDGQNNSTVEFRALNVTDGLPNGAAPDLVLGTGTLATANRVAISFDGAVVDVIYDPGATYPVSVTVGSPGGLTDRTYNVTFVNDPGGGRYVVVEGVMDVNVSIAIFADAAYQALEIEHIAGDDFALTGFGTSTITDDPVLFSVPISVTDLDGDIVNSDDLDITLNPVTTATSSAGSQSAQSFSTSTMLLDDGSISFVASNDNGQDPGSIGISAFNFGANLRAGMRTSELTTVAALSSAFLLSESAVASQFAGGPSFTADIANTVILSGDSTIQALSASPGGSGFDMTGLLGHSFHVPQLQDLAGNNSMGESLNNFVGLPKTVQAQPDQFETMVGNDQIADTAPELMLSPDAGSGVGSAMEALLMLDPAQNASTLGAVGRDDAATEILSDVAADTVVDQLLDRFDDPSSTSDYLIEATGAPDAAILDQFFDTTVNWIEPVQLDLDQVEAATAAATSS